MDTIEVDDVVGGDVVGEAVVARRRRSYSSEEKRRLVAESYEAGTSVALVARRHAINANLLFTWRRQMRGPAAAPEGLGLIPIEVLSDAACPEPAPTAPADRHGEMEIILVGGARVRVDAGVSEPALRRVLSALKAAL